MVIGITNLIRKLKNEPTIYKSGEALLQIRHVTEKWIVYPAKIVKLNNYKPEQIKAGVFRVLMSDEVIYVPDLIMDKSEVSALLYSDRLYYKEHWIDPKNKKCMWGAWFRL